MITKMKIAELIDARYQDFLSLKTGDTEVHIHHSLLTIESLVEGSRVAVGQQYYDMLETVEEVMAEIARKA